MMSNARNRHLTALLTALCLSASIAAWGQEPPIKEGPFDPAAADLDDRWIGVKATDGGGCPQPPGDWQASPVFAPVPTRKGMAVPPALEPFCLYENGTDVADLRGLVASGSLRRLGPDRAPVVPASPAPVLGPQMWRPLRDNFERQAGAVPLDAGYDTPKARLAVIDTSPTRQLEPERHPGLSPHGHALLNMAESLLCATPTGDCVGDLTSRLALAYYVDRNDHRIVHRDEIGGGEFGSLVDLARAIQDEVAEWIDDDADSQLVLNLSLGWDGRYGGLEDHHSSMPPAVESVYLALEDAACRGALIISAAGNDLGGPAAGGPWLPAGWEERAALDHAACEAAVGQALDPADFPGSGAYAPLVYAVSGLRHDGQPLANASPRSQARLAAYADHAVAEGHLPNTPTEILTGSSVAALIASTTAAAVSYYRPDLPAYKVMELLYQTGKDLGRTADFCVETSCTNADDAFGARWLAMCPALTDACAGASCPYLPACQTLGKVAPALPADLVAIFDDSTPAPEPFDARDLTEDHVPPQICGVGWQEYDPDFDRPINPCPERQVATDLTRPWIRPAPESVPCPTCFFEEHTKTLVMEIDLGFHGTLSDPTLTACGNSYRLPPGLPLHPGAKIHVDQIPVMAHCGGPVMLSFIVNGLSSVIDPVLVMP